MARRDENMVILTGNLGADPETRTVPSGSSVTQIRVASSRSFKDSQGELQEQTEWFQVVAWDKLGEIMAQYLQKGSRVYIKGRLQTRSYEDNEGVTKYRTEVIASDMIMLDSRRADGDGDESQEYQAPRERAQNTQRPAQNTQRQPQGAPRGAGNAPRRPPAPTTDDDDLPF